MREDITGNKYNKLTLTSNLDGSVDSYYSMDRVLFKCECGREHVAILNNVVRGNTKQCRACGYEARGKKHTTHGNSMSHRESNPDGYNVYTRWQSMKRRCYKEYDSHYKNYGARGIIMCDRWLNSFENFLTDMGLPPTRKHQIDRKDNDGNYTPENCRWITPKENARNKTNSKIITAFGLSMVQSEWAEKTGLKRETIAMRIRRGWSPEKALSKGSIIKFD